jgi:hypothetical protein
MIRFNNVYEILTSNGFSDFDGIRCSSSSNGVVLKFNDGTEFKCTEDHLLKQGDSFIEAINSLGCDISGKIVIAVDGNSEEDYYYDILETDTHDYISSGLVSHNCTFEGSMATLVHSDHIVAMKDKFEIEPLNTLDEKKLKIFAWPIDKAILKQRNYEYLITVDPAMGTQQDYSVANVWLVRSNTDVEQVACYRSNDVPPHEFVNKILALCKMYHEPYLIIETMETAGGIMIGLLTNEKHYYNIINMQKEGVGFRMHHDIKIKACTLLQVYCEKQVLILRDSTLYGEIEMFGKRGNTFKAIGENNDDCVMSTLAMLNYVNSDYFYGNVDDVSIHKKPTILKTGDMDESDPDISAALSRMRAEDDNKNTMYVAGAIISPGFSGTTHSDAAHWRETNIPNQKNNQMFNPHANGNSFWHYNGY